MAVPRVLVFGFDGVLADTEPPICESWAHVLASHHIALSWEDYCPFGRGVTDEDMLQRLSAMQGDPAMRSVLREEAGTQEQILMELCAERLRSQRPRPPWSRALPAISGRGHSWRRRFGGRSGQCLGAGFTAVRVERPDRLEEIIGLALGVGIVPGVPD